MRIISPSANRLKCTYNVRGHKGQTNFDFGHYYFFNSEIKSHCLTNKNQTQFLIILLNNLSFAYDKSFEIHQILFLTTKYWSHLNYAIIPFMGRGALDTALCNKVCQ